MQEVKSAMMISEFEDLGICMPHDLAVSALVSMLSSEMHAIDISKEKYGCYARSYIKSLLGHGLRDVFPVIFSNLTQETLSFFTW